MQSIFFSCRNKGFQCYCKNVFWSANKNDERAYDNIWKIATGQGDDYTTGRLLDYVYFKNYYKMMAIDVRKQQEPDANPNANQQANFMRNLD